MFLFSQCQKIINTKNTKTVISTKLTFKQAAILSENFKIILVAVVLTLTTMCQTIYFLSFLIDMMLFYNCTIYI